MLEGAEFYALADSIRDTGLNEPITLFEGKILDGRNRYRAAKEVRYNLSEKDFRQLPKGKNPQAFVIHANITRRHLSPEQRRDLIAELIKGDPTQSNRQIAEQTKVSHHTVGDVREGLEATGQVAQLTATKGKDGKTRKVKAKGEKKSQTKSEPKTDITAYTARLEQLMDALKEWPSSYDHADEWADKARKRIDEVMMDWLETVGEGDYQQEAAKRNS